MNLASARVVLRMRSVSETLDLAMKWQVSTRRPYLRLAALVLFPCWVGCVLARVVGGWEWISVWGLAVALGLVVQGVFTVAASRLMFSPDVRVREVIGQFARRFVPFVVGMTLSRALVGATVFTVALGPLAWTVVAFVPEAILLEEQGVVEGLRRASAFNRGQTGATLALCMGLVAAIFGFVVGGDQLGMVLFEFVLQLGRPFGSLWEEGGSATALAGFFAAIPYLATARFLQYIDGRTRRDGWDIQLAFLALTVAAEGAEGGRAA